MFHRTTEQDALQNGHPGSVIASPRAHKLTSHSYYVVMADLGRLGLEAVVHPEDTRRKVVDALAHGEWKHVVFIHHIADGLVEDVTNDLFDEAEALCRLQAAE